MVISAGDGSPAAHEDLAEAGMVKVAGRLVELERGPQQRADDDQHRLVGPGRGWLRRIGEQQDEGELHSIVSGQKKLAVVAESPFPTTRLKLRRRRRNNLTTTLTLLSGRRCEGCHGGMSARVAEEARRGGGRT
jgi:hypothetical protein